ncbi:MAG: nicotinamide-nucleotide amidohydrolase family protein, partial [Bacteroidota bacterium]
ERRGKKLTELNRKQAEVPDKCLVIRNANGTAPGMWFNSDGKIYISIPGVPYEALAMIENFILPKLKAENVLPAIFHYTVHTQGIGESFLAEIIEEWENSLSVENVKLAYLPSPGMVRLRLSGFGDELEHVKHNVMKKKEELIPLISEYIYGYEEYGSPPPKIQKLLGELLIKNRKKIALAESCTGGYISHLITSIPGSSEYYNGGIIPYHNEFKNELLEVDEDVFRLSGAVSEECVKSMAIGIIKKYRSDYSIAVSGIAGPSGGTPEKPVGTVWIAWSNTKETVAEKFIFTNDRERNIHLTAINAMEKMRRMIEKGF